MLLKLQKYENRSLSRMLLPIFGALLLISVVNRLLSFLGDFDNPLLNFFRDTNRSIYVMMIAGVFIATFFLILMRFYKNLLGDEGYLAFTLPVTTDHLLLSKLIPAVLWSVFGMVAVFLSINIILAGGELAEGYGEFFSFLGQALAEFGFHVPLIIFLFCVLMLITTALGFLQFYLAMAVGATVAKNRLVGTVITYIGMNIALQMISGIVFSILGTLFSEPIFAFFNMIEQQISLNSANMLFFVEWFFVICILFYAAISAAYYLVTRHYLKNKLNLA